MDDKAKELYKEFTEALDVAQDKRWEFLDYLEKRYGIDPTDFDIVTRIEDEFDWCYGIDFHEVNELIGEVTK